jgi:hypothetical protein
MESTLSAKYILYLVCAFAAASALALVALTSADKQAGAATDQLPDLAMAKIVDVQIKNCTSTRGDCDFAGQRQLRFSARIVNVGAGAFEAQGSNRSSTGELIDVDQHIFDDTGSYRPVDTKVGNDGSTARMYYSGDGHSHWHVANLQYYSLSSSPVRTGAKEGFCFFDNTKWFKGDANGEPITPGVPSSPFYTECAKDQPGATSVTVGISRGWGDRYGSRTVDQYIDITGLPDGTYRLTTTGDKQDWFHESNESNNSNWATLQIQNGQVSVTGYCSACNPPRV